MFLLYLICGCISLVGGIVALARFAPADYRDYREMAQDDVEGAAALGLICFMVVLGWPIAFVMAALWGACIGLQTVAFRVADGFINDDKETPA